MPYQISCIPYFLFPTLYFRSSIPYRLFLTLGHIFIPYSPLYLLSSIICELFHICHIDCLLYPLFLPMSYLLFPIFYALFSISYIHLYIILYTLPYYILITSMHYPLSSNSHHQIASQIFLLLLLPAICP
jgi:hypothetical protein